MVRLMKDKGLTELIHAYEAAYMIKSLSGSTKAQRSESEGKSKESTMATSNFESEIPQDEGQNAELIDDL